MRILLRLILFFGIVTAGIYCLPQGPEKLEYIAFKLFGVQLSNDKQLQSDVIVERVSDVDTEDSFNDDDYVEVDEEVEDRSYENYAVVPQVNTGSKLQSNRRAIQNVVGENYLDAALSSGKLERWNPKSFPLKVYIQTSGVPIEYVKEIRNAFQTWEKSTNGFVKFSYVNSEQGANYKCLFSNLKNRNCDEKGMGIAGYQYFEYDGLGNIKHSVVEFSVYDCLGRKWRVEDFYSVALHEIGHGLGLRGHSTEDTDLMYPVAVGSGVRRKISKADMNTLRAIYSIIPDVTNIPFSESDKNGLITTEDFWGNSSQRTDYVIPQILENIELTPDNPSLYVELARAYRENKDFQLAVNAYSKALKFVDNSESAVGVLLEAASLYVQLNQYESAVRCLERASKYGKNQYIADMYNYIAVQYAQNRDYNVAAIYFDKAVNASSDRNFQKKVYENFRWLAWQQKDKVMLEKYENILKNW